MMLRQIGMLLKKVKLQPCGGSRSYNKKRLPKVDKTMQAAAESLAARGFLRPVKSYTVPDDVDVKLEQILDQYGLNEQSKFEALELKFNFLRSCFETFKHGISNSLLHTIKCAADVKEFYNTPVDTTNPFEALQKMDLPKNMHVQKDYVRYHPDTDTMFGGVSAFPKSSTIVTGLETRKKYRSFEAKRIWPFS